MFLFLEFVLLDMLEAAWDHKWQLNSHYYILLYLITLEANWMQSAAREWFGAAWQFLGCLAKSRSSSPSMHQYKLELLELLEVAWTTSKPLQVPQELVNQNMSFADV